MRRAAILLLFPFAMKASSASECHPVGYATTKAGRVVAFAVSKKTDRFSGVTTIQTNFLPVPGEAIINLYSWTHSNVSQEYGILIGTESSGLRYTNCRQTYLLADGRPVPITEVKHYSSKLIKPGDSQRVGYAGRVGRLGFLGLGFNINTSPIFLEIVGVNRPAVLQQAARRLMKERGDPVDVHRRRLEGAPAGRTLFTPAIEPTRRSISFHF